MYCYLIEGEVSINEEKYFTGDAGIIINEKSFIINSNSESEIILFEVES